MPEEAPVMRTTFPIKFSLKAGLVMAQKMYFKKIYNGRIDIIMVKVLIGIMMFNSMLMNSMTSFLGSNIYRARQR